jgi:ABC-type Fe3+/spermidine/putrescine transport system ATPase subunit
MAEHVESGGEGESAVIVEVAPRPRAQPVGAVEDDVRLSGLVKRYGETEVVKGIDLSIRRGELFSLLGPSGCGKTTTLRMIAGLETPSAGDVAIRGRSMRNVPINRRPTNLVFQKLALFPHLDVFENIAFGLKLKRLAAGEIRRRVADMLAVVRLDGFERRAVAQLSGGQQQRVAIARALVNEPAVLLLDEPLGALDLKLQIHMQEELKRIQRALGTTFIYVTHNQSEALSLSDRLAVMNEGRIEQIGPPAEIYLRPRTTFVASFVGQTNLLEGRIARLEGGAMLVEAGELSFRLAASPGAAIGDLLFLSLRPERLRPLPPGATAPRSARFRIAAATFLGTTILYELRRSDGGILLMQALADAGMAAPGSEIVVGWNDEDAVPLAAPAAQVRQ